MGLAVRGMARVCRAREELDVSNPSGFFNAPPARPRMPGPRARTSPPPPRARSALSLGKINLGIGLVLVLAVAYMLGAATFAAVALLSVVLLLLYRLRRQPLLALGGLLTILGLGLIVIAPTVTANLTRNEVIARADAMSANGQALMNMYQAEEALRLLTNLQKGIVPASAVWPLWPWLLAGGVLILVGVILATVSVALKKVPVVGRT